MAEPNDMEGDRELRIRGARTFTLIELLVVVAIIAVLVAILLPALGQARYRVKVLTCGSQLKQFGNALTIYASDHSDAFPCHGRLPSWWWWLVELGNSDASEYGGFFSNVYPFFALVYPKYVRVDGLFYCPLDVYRSPARSWPPWKEWKGISYAYLGSYGTQPTVPVFAGRVKRLTDPTSGLLTD